MVMGESNRKLKKRFACIFIVSLLILTVFSFFFISIVVADPLYTDTDETNTDMSNKPRDIKGTSKSEDLDGKRIDGGFTPNCCFPAGTIVRMHDGSLKNIEDVELGDEILSFDHISQKFIFTIVIELIRPVREGVYEINNGFVRPTGDHPFYICKKDGTKGWASINPGMTKQNYPSIADGILELEIGDKMFTLEGGWLEISSIKYSPGNIQTYTFNVDNFGFDADNYFASDMLVHNGCTGGDDDDEGDDDDDDDSPPDLPPSGDPPVVDDDEGDDDDDEGDDDKGDDDDDEGDDDKGDDDDDEGDDDDDEGDDDRSTVIVSFTYSSANPEISQTLQFIDTTQYTGGEILSWEWNFGDNTESYEQNPVHPYSNSGEYTVSLRVVLDDGETGDKYTEDIIIAENSVEEIDDNTGGEDTGDDNGYNHGGGHYYPDPDDTDLDDEILEDNEVTAEPVEEDTETDAIIITDSDKQGKDPKSFFIGENWGKLIENLDATNGNYEEAIFIVIIGLIILVFILKKQKLIYKAYDKTNSNPNKTKKIKKPSINEAAAVFQILELEITK